MAAGATSTLSTQMANYDSVYFPHFEHHQEVGYYSVERIAGGVQRVVQPGSHRHRMFLYQPPGSNFPLDLHEGYTGGIRSNPTERPKILNWLMSKDGHDEFVRLKPDFVTSRGRLSDCMCTPYSQNERDDWAMTVTLFNGVYYMNHGDQNMHEIKPNLQLWHYRGYKFEQHMTSVDGLTPPNTKKDINHHDVFYSVVHFTLNKHRLLVNGEVDCCRGDITKPGTYVELKTTKMNSSITSDFKLRKWWAQTALLNIPEIICGVHSGDGMVTHLNQYKTKDIPKTAFAWKEAVCMNFLDQLLSFIKAVVVEDDPSVVYIFKTDIWGQRILWSRSQEPSHRFLSDEYIRHVRQMGRQGGR